MRDSTPGASRWTWIQRAPLARAGSCTWGKFTAPRVAPVSLNSISLRATSWPMWDCASAVLPPICGVSTTLRSPCSGVAKGSPLRGRLHREDIDRGAQQMAGLQRRRQRIEIDHACRGHC